MELNIQELQDFAVTAADNYSMVQDYHPDLSGNPLPAYVTEYMEQCIDRYGGNDREYAQQLWLEAFHEAVVEICFDEIMEVVKQADHKAWSH